MSERYSYGAYGESGSTSAVGNPYRYTGRELDAETGLYYYRARYYSPGLGRFLSPDPTGYGDGLNLYAYVGNDPLNLRDPSGLLAQEVATRSFSVYNNLTSGLISQPQRMSTALNSYRGPGLSVAQAFDRSNPRHDYINVTQVCSNCSVSQVQDAQYFHQYPFQSGIRVEAGATRNIGGTDLLAIRIQESQSVSGGVVLSNQTLSTHLLHNGRVDRAFEARGNNVYMVTHGYGANTGPMTATLNQLVGPWLFDFVDHGLIEQINNR